MCRPGHGSSQDPSTGGHIGPPLRDAGNVPEITEIGTENEHSPCGAGRSPPPTGGAEQASGGVYLGHGFRPKFRSGIWGVSHGHRPLRPAGDEGRGTARRVVVPYGCVTGSAQQRADVGIGPYALRRTARRGRRATGGCGEPPRLPWPAAHSGVSAPAGARDGWESRQRPSPKGASNAGQSLSHGEAVTAPVVPRAWPPSIKFQNGIWTSVTVPKILCSHTPTEF